MVRKTQILILVTLVFLWSDGTVGQSLQSEAREKLHPVFQSLLAGQKGGGGMRESVGFSKEGEALYEAIITTTDVDAVRASGIHLNSVFGKIATAHLTRQQIASLAHSAHVQYLDPGSVNFPSLDLSVPEIGASLLHSGFLNKTPYRGKGVIVVIYDTGIDWRHLDFRDPSDTTKSRILAIWDQTLNIVGGSGEKRPNGFTYGVEYTKAQIENELDGSPANVVREKDINGHGTHVAGIAAGNGSSYFNKYVGVAPEADIIVVKGGDNSFSEARMIDCLTYAGNKAAEFAKPVVINWSIGGQSGPHDGTRGYEVAVDSFVQTPGRVVTISAGNDGAQSIHVGGSAASGGSASFVVNVPPYTPAYGANNDDFTLEIWFNSAVGLTATVTSPGGISVSAATDSSSEAGNKGDGDISLFNANGSNGKRYIQLRVSDSDSLKVPKSGKWNVALSSFTSAAAFDAWISEASVGSATVTIAGGDNQKTVSSPGTSTGAITVGSYLTKNTWPSINGLSYLIANPPPPEGSLSNFSSVGPTADGRIKPDLTAPGQRIAAPLSGGATASISSTMPYGNYHVMQGTSMASPHVAGAAALLLQISATSSASQIKSLLTTTGTSEASMGTLPNSSWGFGKLDILHAAARSLNPSASVLRQNAADDMEGSSSTYSLPLTGTTKFAYRFTPSFSGQLTGMHLGIRSGAERSLVGTGSLVCEVWSNNAVVGTGIPGARIGAPVLVSFKDLSVSTLNYVDMTSAGVTLNSGQEYHVVVSNANPSDTIKVVRDQSGITLNKYSVFSAGGWSAAGGNLRLRASITSLSGLVWAETENTVPLAFDLSQNYPNPFNPSTTISYQVSAGSRTMLRIFDILGREVASLVNEVQVAGRYIVNWNGKDNLGRPLSSGVYLYRLESGGMSIVRKMVLMK